MPCIKNLSVAGANNRLMATDIFYVDTLEAKPVVLYLHGFNGFKDWGDFGRMAQTWADAGFVVVTFNFSHNGASLERPDELHDLEAYGHNNYSKECFDLRCMLDFIGGPSFPIPQHIRLDRLWLLGHSRGGGIAIVQAADPRVFGLITWAAVAELKTPWAGYSEEKLRQWQNEGVVYYTNQRTGIQYPLYYQLYDDFQKNTSALDVAQHLQQLRKPVLLCYSVHDMAVPLAQGLRLSACLPSATLFIVHSDHVFGRKHPAAEGPLPEAMQQVLERSILFCQENEE
jgi:pimeloyl-ACP methyl ester carboxylesterase